MAEGIDLDALRGAIAALQRCTDAEEAHGIRTAHALGMAYYVPDWFVHSRHLLRQLEGLPDRLAALERVAELARASRLPHIRPGDTDHADAILERLDAALEAAGYGGGAG